jgi:putative ABC transport system permease protein
VSRINAKSLLAEIAPLGRIAVRNVGRQKRRTFAATIAVSFGVIAFILAGGFIDWLIWGMAEFTIKAHLGHVQIMRPGFLDSGMATPFDFLISDREQEKRSVEDMDGVVVVSTRLSLSGLISRGEATQSFVGDGVDPKAELALSSTMKIVDGENLAPGDSASVILGQGLAASLGVRVGEKVVLLANTKSGGVNAIELMVRGTFSTVSKAYDDIGLRLPISQAQHLLKVSGAHKWVLLLDDTGKTERVVAELIPKLKAQGLEVVPWTDLADFYNKTVTLFKRQVTVMKFIIAAIIMLSITNTMMMSVMERTGEIGTTMALGRSKRDVLLGFVFEGMLLGIVGGVVGAIVGFGLAKLISIIGIPMPPPPGMAQGFTAGILVTPGLIIEGLVLSVFTTLVAAIYPSWKASQLVIVDALRHNR